MLTKYILAALKLARYEILEDDGSFYGEIPDLAGVYANSDTLEVCREELREVLEEWILFRLARSLPMPTIDGIELRVSQVA
jgi:predicted RNase H-like HicB family nuclease